jgi:CubicO group peptidase (beta-lactamase class C family)
MKNLIFISLTVLLFNCKTISQNSSTNQNSTEITIENIITFTDKKNKEGKFNGTILIAQDSKVLLNEAYGYQNAERKTPNTIDTKYEIASMGKMFTAISILQLYQKGKIDFNQTIGDILPKYPNEKVKKTVTIEQLLTHTSGLGDFFSKEFFELPEGSIQKLEDYLPFFANDPLEFQSGEKFRYSNGGFIVLGLIIERVTNQSFNDYVKENILEETKMQNTGPLSSSAGGGLSTVSDLHKFALALKEHKLISKKSMNLMKSDRFGNGYGYGLSLNKLNDTSLYGHNGGAPGVSGELDIVENSSLIIVSLSNRSAMDGWAQVRTFMRSEFFGSTPEIEEFLNTEAVIEEFEKNGFDSAKIKLQELDNNISDKNTFHYAQTYLNHENFEKAISIMKLIVVASPNEWYPYSFLADFYLKAGNTKDAILNYEKSLKFNPENQQAIDRLKTLRN